MEPIPESTLNLLKLRNRSPGEASSEDRGNTGRASGLKMTDPTDAANSVADENRDPSGTNANNILPLPGAQNPAGNIPDEFHDSLSTIRLRPVLSVQEALEKIGQGLLCVVGEQDGLKLYGRATTVAERAGHDKISLVKWVRRLINWHGRDATLAAWKDKIMPLIQSRLAQRRTPVIRFEDNDYKISAVLSLADLTMRVPVDSYGVPIWRPIEREVIPRDCAICALVPVCRQLPTATGVAMLWRRLGLVDAAGVPTRRGRIMSFFSQGDGLAVAAALEDDSYDLDELVYDLANLDAGFRFCQDENRWGGRLAMLCQRAYGIQSIPGYLENGVPPRYGWGASDVVQSVHKDPLSKSRWVTEFLGAGDIDRVIIEWRSMLRRISHSPSLDWARWTALQHLAKTILNETESPTETNLPPLEYLQTKRMEHTLSFRRH
jgi:hypothetical protein